jgi:hypothetical protein
MSGDTAPAYPHPAGRVNRARERGPLAPFISQSRRLKMRHRRTDASQRRFATGAASTSASTARGRGAVPPLDAAHRKPLASPASAHATRLGTGASQASRFAWGIRWAARARERIAPRNPRSASRTRPVATSSTRQSRRIRSGASRSPRPGSGNSREVRGIPGGPEALRGGQGGPPAKACASRGRGCAVSGSPSGNSRE